MKDKVAYERPKKVRAIKIKHPKGYGTDKERHTKKVWHEVKCLIHGRGDSKMMKVSPPLSRYEKNVQGCPICANISRREKV